MIPTGNPQLTAENRFYQTGGTLSPDAPSYIERQADTDLYEALSRSEFCYVLTSRQRGKSSLMVRVAARLRREGITVAGLDLTSVGQNLTADQWYGGLLGFLGRQLDLEDELEEFWFDHEHLGPLQRWMAALREVLLERVPGRIVISIDEIDTVRSLSFSTDEFFAAIRACHNRRSEDPAYTRLTFCLLGVATPSDLIQDTRMTPFNIGRRIELDDFTEAEAAPLAQGISDLGFRISDCQAVLRRILYWTGGHPYLTQRLCRAVADAVVANPKSEIRNLKSVDRLCEELFLSPDARERDDNLTFVRDRLLRSGTDLAALLDLYARVRSGKRIRGDDANPLIDILGLSGIVRAREGRLQVRNRIYERVFDREWTTEHMPDAELRRQRAAYRRGVYSVRLAYLIVVGLFILVAKGNPLFTRLELMTLDWRFLQRGPRPPGPDVVLVTIDEKSLTELGSMPWPRSYHAALVDVLRRQGAAVVAFDVRFTEPQHPREDAAFAEAMRRAGNVLLAGAYQEPATTGSTSAAQAAVLVPGGRLRAEKAMLAKSPASTPNSRSSQRTLQLGWSPPIWLPPETKSLFWTLPIPEFLEAARGVGIVTLPGDADAIYRRAFPLWPVDNGRMYPQLALLAAAQKLGVSPRDIRAHRDFKVHLKEVRVGRIPPDAFRGKIVFVGSTALSEPDQRPSPYSQANVGVETNANLANAVLQNRFFTHPRPWFLLVLLGSMVWLVFEGMLAVSSPVRATTVALLTMSAYALIALWLFCGPRIVVPMVLPLIAMGLCYVFALGYQFQNVKEAKW